MGNGSFLGVK